MLTNGFNQISAALEDSGCLRSVERVRVKEPFTGTDLLSGQNLEAFCFSFDQGLLTARVEGADDTVSVEAGFSEEFAWPIRQDLSDQKPWTDVVGKELWEVWALTNSNGYLDAIQFKFGEAGNEAKARIQLEAAASGFVTFVVDRQGP